MAVGGRGRSRLRLGLLVITALVLMTLDFRNYGPLETAQSGVRDLLQPLISVVDTVLGPVGDAWNAVVGYSDLRSANLELQAEVDRLKGNEIQVEADLTAYRRLVEATGIDYIGDVERVTASVLRDVVGNFHDGVIMIDKGRHHGIVPGMTVVTGAGFVGRTETVGANQSTILMVSNPDLIISVRLLDTDEVGLGHGVAGDPGLFVVDTGLSWPEFEDIENLAEVGSAVVTARSSRYLADIPIGRIVSVEPARSSLTQLVTVELSVDTSKLGFVTVLMQEPINEPPSGPDSPFVDVLSDAAETS